MKRWKRLFYYLLLNVLVSACTTLAVLVVWERTHPSFLPSLGSLNPLSSPSPAVVALLQAVESDIAPEPTPTRALFTYRVEPGDTLGYIAEKFEVSVKEIIDINLIADPNALGSGQVLFIPFPLSTPSVALSDPVNTPAPDAALTNPTDEPRGTPQTPVNPSTEADSQVAITNVFGAGDLPTERVRLERRGEGNLALAGWQLVEQSGRIFTFPDLTLFKDGAVDIYTRTGVSSVVALYWGIDQPVWEAGETVTLRDPAGIIRSVYTIP